MREYKIIKSDLGWNILRRKEENWFTSIRFLNWLNKRTLNRTYARTFYHREDAIWALILIRRKNEKDSD